MKEETNSDRRRFLGAAAMALAATQLGMFGCTNEKQPSTAVAAVDPPTNGAGKNKSFDSLKQIEAGVLNVGYAEAGPADGPAVILLHGWPYDIYSFVDVTPMLASAGFHVIVPYFAGMARQHFFPAKPSAMDSSRWSRWTSSRLMDALKIERAVIGGFDWGGDGGYHGGALARAMQGDCFGQRIFDREPGGQQAPLPPAAEYAWWYQFYFATEARAGGV